LQAKPFAFRMATSILLGLDLSDDRAKAFTGLFEIWLKGFMGVPFDLPFTTFGRAMRAREQLLAMVEEVVLQRLVRDTTSTSTTRRNRHGTSSPSSYTT
jgi:cytochrome P450